MKLNSSISPLPFYLTLAEQNHRKDYAFGHIYPLIIKASVLIPFQFTCSSEVTGIGDIYLIDADTDISLGSINLKEAGLSLIDYGNFKLIKFLGQLPLTTINKEGRYYLKMYLQGYNNYIYSDIFTSVNDTSGFVSVTYKNSNNILYKGGIIDFNDGFSFQCYLNTIIGKPEYEFEEEVTERMGYSFIESQVSKKTYRFTFLAPEFLCDALRLVKLCDTRIIADKFKEYRPLTLNLKPEWEDQGDLAAVECEFSVDNIIANVGGYTPEGLGDFNNDFNNDFDI